MIGYVGGGGDIICGDILAALRLVETFKKAL